MGEMHALITLDNGEVRRLMIPQAIAVPQGIANSYLLAATPFLIAGHRYTCNLQQPKLHFRGGGTYTMNVVRGHHTIQITPTDANIQTPHKTILMHNQEPYDPPTFHNHSTNIHNRPNLQTPTAFVYHLRFGCACEQVLKHTQEHVIGLKVQKVSWKRLRQRFH